MEQSEITGDIFRLVKGLFEVFQKQQMLIDSNQRQIQTLWEALSAITGGQLSLDPAQPQLLRELSEKARAEIADLERLWQRQSPESPKEN